MLQSKMTAAEGQDQHGPFPIILRFDATSAVAVSRST